NDEERYGTFEVNGGLFFRSSSPLPFVKGPGLRNPLRATCDPRPMTQQKTWRGSHAAPVPARYPGHLAAGCVLCVGRIVGLGSKADLAKDRSGNADFAAPRPQHVVGVDPGRLL